MHDDPERRGPLSDVRVLEFSWFGAGPIAVRLMADHGAEVIRVESEARIDALRTAPPKPQGMENNINASGYFNNFNPGKMSLSLNLSRPEAQQICLRLAERADLVVDNFKAGVMARWGLGYDDLRKVNPQIIVVSMPAVGMEGPRSYYGGFGTGIKAIAGLQAISGYPDRIPACPPGAYPDYCINPGHALVAMMSALYHKRRTGQGQFIEVAQYESTTCVSDTALLDYFANARIQGPAGNSDRVAAPHDVYACAGDDRWIAIAVYDDAQWLALRRAMGEPAWAADPSLDSAEGRRTHSARVNEGIAAWTKGHVAEDLFALLQQHGVPAGVCQTNEDLQSRDPHLRERGYYATLEHAEVGPSMYDNPPFRLTTTPGASR
ncbi:MAG TPA: CoA transferase, partial [Dehalococcoidia bacterium]|nr:CoA transferase [Dehalococcoidia bacterium]